MTFKAPFWMIVLIISGALLVSCSGAKHDVSLDYSQKLNQALAAEDYEAADKLMKKLNSDFPGGPFRDSFLMKWAAIKVKSEQFQDAKVLLQELITDYPKSLEIEKAKKLLGWVENKITTQPQPAN